MSLGIGDIFHAEFPNGASLICLVLSVTDTVIEARRVTTQEHLSFDRQTGVDKSGKKSVCTIDSIAPLPEEIYNVIISLDYKYQIGNEFKTDADFEKFKLTSAEKKAFSFIASYYPSNPL